MHAVVPTGDNGPQRLCNCTSNFSKVGTDMSPEHMAFSAVDLQQGNQSRVPGSGAIESVPFGRTPTGAMSEHQQQMGAFLYTTVIVLLFAATIVYFMLRRICYQDYHDRFLHTLATNRCPVSSSEAAAASSVSSFPTNAGKQRGWKQFGWMNALRKPFERPRRKCSSKSLFENYNYLAVWQQGGDDRLPLHERAFRSKVKRELCLHLLHMGHLSEGIALGGEESVRLSDLRTATAVVHKKKSSSSIMGRTPHLGATNGHGPCCVRLESEYSADCSLDLVAVATSRSADDLGAESRSQFSHTTTSSSVSTCGGSGDSPDTETEDTGTCEFERPQEPDSHVQLEMEAVVSSKKSSGSCGHHRHGLRTDDDVRTI